MLQQVFIGFVQDYHVFLSPCRVSCVTCHKHGQEEFEYLPHEIRHGYIRVFRFVVRRLGPVCHAPLISIREEQEIDG